MLAALVALSAAASIPTPHDLLTAETALLAPAGTDPPAESGRMRTALLVVMSRTGAVDPGVEGQWFGPLHPFASEVDYARGVVAQVRAVPAVPDRLPPPAWFAEEAGRLRWLASAYRQRAAEYRERIDWEPHRAEALGAWARWLDGEADRLSELACRCDWWGVPSWSRPRRLLAAERWPGWE